MCIANSRRWHMIAMPRYHYAHKHPAVLSHATADRMDYNTWTIEKLDQTNQDLNINVLPYTRHKSLRLRPNTRSTYRRLTKDEYVKALQAVDAERTTSLFLNLPPELRILIYGEALTPDPRQGGDSGNLALVKVCKQIRAEAMPVLFDTRKPVRTIIHSGGVWIGRTTIVELGPQYESPSDADLLPLPPRAFKIQAIASTEQDEVHRLDSRRAGQGYDRPWPTSRPPTAQRRSNHERLSERTRLYSSF